MDLARWLLLVGLAISLALSFLAWPVAPVLTGTFIAAAMIWVSVVAPRRHISKPASIIATLTASLGFGVFLQTVPLKLTNLANPIWSAMGAALGEPTVGYITVDLPYTVVALAEYLVIFGAGLTAAVSCVVHERGWEMPTMAWLMTIYCGAYIIMFSGIDRLQAGIMTEHLVAQWTSLSMFGVLTAISLIIRLQIRFRRLRITSRFQLLRQRVGSFAIPIGMIAIFLVPLFVFRLGAASFPSICAILVLLAVVLAKRFAFGLAGAIFALAIVIGGLWSAGLVANVVGPNSSANFGAETEADIAMFADLFRDFRWFGSGLGTYPRIMPMYAAIQDSSAGHVRSAPLVLSSMVELGIPMTLLAVFMLAMLAWSSFSKLAKVDGDYSTGVLSCSILVYIVVATVTPGMSLPFPTMLTAAITIGFGLASVQEPVDGITSGDHSLAISRSLRSKRC